MKQTPEEPWTRDALSRVLFFVGDIRPTSSSTNSPLAYALRAIPQSQSTNAWVNAAAVSLPVVRQTQP